MFACKTKENFNEWMKHIVHMERQTFELKFTTNFESDLLFSGWLRTTFILLSVVSRLVISVGVSSKLCPFFFSLCSGTVCLKLTQFITSSLLFWYTTFFRWMNNYCKERRAGINYLSSWCFRRFNDSFIFMVFSNQKSIAYESTCSLFVFFKLLIDLWE